MSFSFSCPICGRLYSETHSSFAHRCPKVALDIIDAANEYAGDAELFANVEPVSEYWPEPIAYRIDEGFWILNTDDD